MSLLLLSWGVFKQGGITDGAQQICSTSYPIAYETVLSISIVQLWDSGDDKFAPRIMSYNTNSFESLWGAKWYYEDNRTGRKAFWVSLGY